MSDDSGRDWVRVARALALYGVVLAGVAVALLYAGAQAAALNFGNVMFALTALCAVGSMLVAGWGKRMDAARPEGELFRLSATRYGRESAADRSSPLSAPARALVVLAGTVVLGWAVVVATL